MLSLFVTLYIFFHLTAMYSSTFGKGCVGRSCLYLLVWVSFGSISLRELTCMHCVYLALWTRKVLCGSFLCAIYKFSFIHSFISFPSSSSGITPRTDCPDYVPENADLSCSCLAPDNFQGTASLSWPGHSDTDLLTVTSVHREDNGTRYTCQMVAGGTTTSTVYTLKVACEYENRSTSALICLGLYRFPFHWFVCCQFSIYNNTRSFIKGLLYSYIQSCVYKCSVHNNAH